MTETEYTAILLNELNTTIQTIGVTNTVKILKNARTNAITLEDPNVNFVLKYVCTEIELSIDEVIQSNSRDDERLIAISITCYMLHHVFGYQMKSLCTPFKKTKSAISKYYSYVAKAKKAKFADKDPFQKKLMTIYRKTLPIVLDYKNKSNTSKI